jgi:hypothetical protein
VCCYFQDFREEHYVGPRLAVETVCQFIASHERSETTIVDVAAGTGLVGLEVAITKQLKNIFKTRLNYFLFKLFTLQLCKQGFKLMDAVDGSEDMLEKLTQKQIYRRTTQVHALFRSLK